MAKKRIKVTDVNYNQDHLIEVEESDIPSGIPTAEQLAEVIEGSETVVVDVSESGDKLEVHLDADVVAKVDNSMQLPVAPPVSTALVGIEHSGSQTMIGVGEGLEIDNGVLKATGGGSGGTKLYRHKVSIKDADNQPIPYCFLYITTNRLNPDLSDSYNLIIESVSLIAENGTTSNIDYPKIQYSFLYSVAIGQQFSLDSIVTTTEL